MADPAPRSPSINPKHYPTGGLLIGRMGDMGSSDGRGRDDAATHETGGAASRARTSIRAAANAKADKASKTP